MHILNDYLGLLSGTSIDVSCKMAGADNTVVSFKNSKPPLHLLTKQNQYFIFTNMCNKK